VAAVFPDYTGAEMRIRFDTFEADLRSGELWKQGLKVRLGEQPFSVLALLLAQPGEVVTRDELQKKLWPRDTFVDFDRGLNKAINRLRDALGDSADVPRFIETLPKRGYRFIGTLNPSAPATEAAPSSEPPASRSQPWLAWGIAVAVLAIVAAWGLTRNAPTQADPGPLIRSSILPPPQMKFVPHSLALSRDGTHLAFVAEAADGSRSLWVRAMSATAATAIAGTEGASLPFWSADMRHVGFFADRKLKVVDVAGGVIRVIADARRASGGTWNTADVIVFAPDVNGPLYRVSAAGGTPAMVSQVAENEAIRGHRWPVFLPDGRHFLYTALSIASTSDNAPELRVGSLETFESSRIDWEGSRSVAYALDHLVYVRGGRLYAQPFDRSALRTVGPAAPITGADVSVSPAFFRSELAVSTSGVLVFQSSADLPSQLIWLDVHGQEQGPLLPAMKYHGPAVSPDGRLLAGACEGPRSGTLAICVFDLERAVASRITEGTYDRYPVWSPDGREIAYASGTGIFRVPANGSGSPQFVSSRGIPTGWLPDGRILSFGSQRGVVSLALSSPVTHEVTELGPGAEAQLSPDATWLAWVARDGLVVQRFGDPAARVTITGDGAAQPRWSRDGRQLFYISTDKKLVAVDFDAATVTAGVPRILAQTRIIGAGLIGFQYDVARDGRFILNALTSDPAPLTLMSGWASELKH
jgi:eukaryotic-like serine/threonine-protein kinase